MKRWCIMFFDLSVCPSFLCLRDLTFGSKKMNFKVSQTYHVPVFFPFQCTPVSNRVFVCLSVGTFLSHEFFEKGVLTLFKRNTLMWNVQMTSDSHLTSIFENVFHTLIYARVFIIANTLNLESGIHINFISTWNASECFLSRESQKKKHGK